MTQAEMISEAHKISERMRLSLRLASDASEKINDYQNELGFRERFGKIHCLLQSSESIENAMKTRRRHLRNALAAFEAAAKDAAALSFNPQTVAA